MKTTINQLTQRLNEDLAQMTQASKKKKPAPARKKAPPAKRPSPMTLDKAEDILSAYVTNAPGSEIAFEKLCAHIDAKRGPGSCDDLYQFANDAQDAYADLEDERSDTENEDYFGDEDEDSEAFDSFDMLASEELEKLMGGKRRSLKM